MGRKHAERWNDDEPFADDDYALPLLKNGKIRPSCKQWETIVASPALAWYQLLKLEPVPLVATDTPALLWVGNWVHQALAADASPAGVDKFFQLSADLRPSLSWAQARARAFGVAKEFSLILQNFDAQTVEVEKSVSGSLKIEDVEISLNGRIDRVIKTSDGTIVIVDFKTSSSAEALTEKKLKDGDGLQLWLYGRLLQQGSSVGLCRLSPGGSLAAQVQMGEDRLPAEKQMAQIAKTGVLGSSPGLWERFGEGERLPWATLPIADDCLNKKRSHSHGA